MKLKIMLWK